MSDPPTGLVTVGKIEPLLLIFDMGVITLTQLTNFTGLLRSKEGKLFWERFGKW